MPNRSQGPSPHRRQQLMPVTVAEDAFQRPLSVMRLREELRVDSIDQHWGDDAQIWKHKPVSRLHYNVTLEYVQHLPMFKNMDHGGWYRWDGMR